MLKFLLGFAVAIVVVLTAGFCYVRFGFIDPRADLSVSWLENKVAMPALDAAVNRRPRSSATWINCRRRSRRNGRQQEPLISHPLPQFPRRKKRRA